MTSVTVSAVVTAHNRRGFLAEAVRSALDSGADEVIVVRNFDGPIEGCEGRYRDLRCDIADTGEKEARGLEVATGDVVAYLDDDDVWEATKVPRIRERFGSDGRLVYFCHAQRAIDRSGQFVHATHREIEGKDPTQFASADRDDLRFLVERVWTGNNSSTVIRRSWALGWVPTLREAGWACDLFWFVAALLGDGGIELSPEPLVRLRLHDQNMSQTRGASSPDEFRRRHAASSTRFARAYDVMSRAVVARRGTGSPFGRFLDQGATAFHFFADLETGTRPRAAAWKAIWHGPGLRQRGVLGTAFVALLSPAEARRLLFRASLRRWELR
ncbi:MAG TPA: glycosyltransferase [Thermoplasmata archaeon]|nr:glycosyltransferase [Thermoplasmata archaeon]